MIYKIKIHRINVVFHLVEIIFCYSNQLLDFFTKNNIKYTKSMNDEYLFINNFSFLNKYGIEIIGMNLLQFDNISLLNYSYDKKINNIDRNELAKRIQKGKNKNVAVIKVKDQKKLSKIINIEKYSNEYIEDNYYLCSKEIMKDIIGNII